MRVCFLQKEKNVLCANGRVVQGGGLKPHYLRMRRFEPCFAHFFLRFGLYSSEVEHHTCNVGVSGSIPDEGMARSASCSLCVSVVQW